MNEVHLNRSSHFPPIEVSLLLKKSRGGTVKTTDKLKTPTNEHGIPDANETLAMALETLSSDYIFPNVNNVHHLVYPRRRYYEHNSSQSIPAQYRETASLMRRMPIQLHNYWHEIFEHPIEPKMDVMQQWVKEQAQVDQLFYFGKTAIQLSRSKYNQLTDDEITEHHLRYQSTVDSKLFENLFYDFLDSYDDSQLGLLPDRDLLSRMTLTRATRELGVLAGARAIDIRRDSQRKIKKVGFNVAA